MIHSLKKLFKYDIRGTDGEIGEVFDFYFDDGDWTIRYLIVDTGKWLPGRKVLLSPAVAGRPNWERHYLPVDLTKDQVSSSPPIEVDKPVDWQYEELLSQHYGWPVYQPHAAGVPVPAGAVFAGEATRRPEHQLRAQGVHTGGDPHLRSVRDVTGYGIHALDGDIGSASDFIADTDGWAIRYLVVDTGKWLPGRKVLVAPEWVDSVDWGERRVTVSLSRDEVKNSPEFESTQAVNREYEAQLYDYYGRPKYW